MINSNVRIKLSLYINYFVFAILLNSVGIVILKSQKNYGVDEVTVSILELCKDMPIAIVSFLVASFLPRIGYKKAMLIGLGMVSVATLIMYFGNSFNSAKILFATVGAAFALIKVSVYSTIGLITETKAQHNSLMSSIEGFFMFGIALAYFLFPAFNHEGNPDAWLNVYWVLFALSILSFLFLWSANYDKNIDIPGVNILDDIKQSISLLARLFVLVFLASAFLFVMVEQGIMTWLPSFNERVLSLSENMAVMMASILAISLGIGRLLAGLLSKYFSWFWILMGCIISAMAIFWFVLPQAVNASVGPITSLKDVPFIGYVFPMIGLFIAPIYPLINSVVLSSLPKSLHSGMSGLIIVFSAIGGTLGSRLIGYLFKNVGAELAFGYLIIPMIALMITLVLLRILTNKASIHVNT